MLENLMFFIRRTVIEIGRSSVRHNFRSYCNAAKRFKQPTASAVGQESFSHGNSNKNHSENETENEKDDSNKKEEDNSKQNENQLNEETNLMVRSNFDEISLKNRETFISMLHMFVDRDKHRRHHVEFIYQALKHMKEFGVERDIEVYKEIMNIFPKGKMVPTNMFQAEFFHYPKHQDCAIFLLDQMEYNAVIPDAEIEVIIENTFGKRSHPMYKFWRMAYWMPKFKFLSPWLLPDPVPEDSLELAKLAVRQMCTVDVESTIHVYQTETIEDSLDKTWIVSGQSPEQQKLLSHHALDSPLKVQGPYAIWLRNRSINYFTLIGEAEPEENFAPEEDVDDVRNIKIPKFLKFMAPDQNESEVEIRKPQRSIHQQDDGTIYAICATGTSTKDSLLSWIRLLEKDGNPQLAHLPVLFTFRTPVDDRALVVVNNSNDSKERKTIDKK